MDAIVLPEDLKKEVTSIEEMTRVVCVRNSDERTLVFQAVQSVKQKKNRIVEFFADMKEKAFKAHRAIVAAEKAETDKLDAFEAAGKRAILTWDRAEEEKREAERRRLQAIADEQARKEREKAEAEARRQREIEEAARRKAEEARRAAEAASAAERAKLLKEAEAAERKAAAAQAKAEVQAETAAAVVAPTVQIAQAAPKEKGESTRGIWRARVINAGEVPREWLIVDEKALAAFAKATKGAKQISGVQFYEDKSLSVRE
jgi:hypothetical protein